MKSSQKPRILNVDDTEAGRYATTRVLHQAGFEVLEATTGHEALRLAEECPDLILLDVQLPDISGLEVCRRIRADGQTAGIPVVHLSATFVGSDDQATGMEQGADGYLTQPVDPRVLVATINAFLRLKATERSLHESEQRFRVLFEGSHDAIMTLHPPSWRFASCNAACLALFGARDEAHFTSRPPWDWSPDVQPDGRPSAEKAKQMIDKAMAEGSLFFEWTHQRTNGETFPATVLLARVDSADQHFLQATIRDTTEEKQKAAEKEKLQAQLAQAQKMESVGRLAGGVAHDFNNMLMGIMNYAELCRDKLEPDHPIREWLDEITEDAERSAKLTRQLLTFARKQIIAPKVIDLNDAISSILKLLRHLIGEDIAITLRPGPNVWPVKMDPTQFDQILANLAVNARDAIGGVGTISIETGNTTLDEAHSVDDPESVPGDYTLLTVTDSGCGMDEETLKNIFEPFFTTKGEGEGTGLGLATVYGIVKQNNGFIEVDSEPGKGTTFKIYMPRVADAEATECAAKTPTSPPLGNETILLVEDEKSVRVTTHLFLEDLGYTVFVAEAPEQALRVASEHSGQIDLLITDVIMPGMSGRDLADRLLELRPSIKRLFISGFTADIIAQRGILDDGVNFLSKPFGRDVLARKVREVLDV